MVVQRVGFNIHFQSTMRTLPQLPAALNWRTVRGALPHAEYTVCGIPGLGRGSTTSDCSVGELRVHRPQGNGLWEKGDAHQVAKNLS